MSLEQLPKNIDPLEALKQKKAKDEKEKENQKNIVIANKLSGNIELLNTNKVNLENNINDLSVALKNIEGVLETCTEYKNWEAEAIDKFKQFLELENKYEKYEKSIINEPKRYINFIEDEFPDYAENDDLCVKYNKKFKNFHTGFDFDWGYVIDKIFSLVPAEINVPNVTADRDRYVSDIGNVEQQIIERKEKLQDDLAETNIKITEVENQNIEVKGNIESQISTKLNDFATREFDALFTITEDSRRSQKIEMRDSSNNLNHFSAYDVDNKSIRNFPFAEFLSRIDKLKESVSQKSKTLIEENTNIEGIDQEKITLATIKKVLNQKLFGDAEKLDSAIKFIDSKFSQGVINIAFNEYEKCYKSPDYFKNLNLEIDVKQRLEIHMRTLPIPYGASFHLREVIGKYRDLKSQGTFFNPNPTTEFKISARDYSDNSGSGIVDFEKLTQILEEKNKSNDELVRKMRSMDSEQIKNYLSSDEFKILDKQVNNQYPEAKNSVMFDIYIPKDLVNNITDVSDTIERKSPVVDDKRDIYDNLPAVELEKCLIKEKKLREKSIDTLLESVEKHKELKNLEKEIALEANNIRVELSDVKNKMIELLKLDVISMDTPAGGSNIEQKIYQGGVNAVDTIVWNYYPTKFNDFNLKFYKENAINNMGGEVLRLYDQLKNSGDKTLADVSPIIVIGNMEDESHKTFIDRTELIKNNKDFIYKDITILFRDKSIDDDIKAKSKEMNTLNTKIEKAREFIGIPQNNPGTKPSSLGWVNQHAVHIWAEKSKTWNEQNEIVKKTSEVTYKINNLGNEIKTLQQSGVKFKPHMLPSFTKKFIERMKASESPITERDFENMIKKTSEELEQAERMYNEQKAFMERISELNSKIEQIDKM